MTNEHHTERSDDDGGARADALTSEGPGGAGQKEQEPGRSRFVTAAQTTRSDAEIRASLDALLGESDAFDATGLELLVTAGVVVMLGVVPDYRTKRELERKVAEVPGVREIHDQLQVRSGGDAESAAGLRGDPPPTAVVS